MINLASEVSAIAQSLVEMSEQLVRVAARMLAETPAGNSLPVPYLSQWGTGADVRRGDCGPASLAMIVHWKTAHRPTVDQVADACGQPRAGDESQYTGHAQLRTGAQHYGVTLETRSPYTERYGKPKLDTTLLRRQINQGLPSIVLVHYGVLRDRTNALAGVTRNQDQSFGRGHWFLVVGYDEENVYVNDPDFWNERAVEGDHRCIPWSAFEEALASTAPGCTVGFQGLIVVS